MIWESWHWKKPLLEMAGRLRSLKNAKELDQETLVQLERDIFIGFYSVRKLFDTVTKVTDATKNSKVRVRWHANLKPVTWRNNHRIDQCYNLSISNREMHDARFVAGRIIHSFIFVPVVDEGGGLEGILFTSDIDKNEKLYSLDIDEVIALFERVGNDDPTSIRWMKHPSGLETTEVS